MDFTVLRDITDFKPFQEDLGKADTIYLDIEATGLDPYSATITLIQVNVNNNIYIIDTQLLGDRYSKYFVELLEASDKVCVGHNVKYEIKMLYHTYGVLLKNVYDTQIAEFLCYAGVQKPYYKLDYLVELHTGVQLDKTVRDKFIDNLFISDDMYVYAADDVRYLPDIMHNQLEKIADYHLEAVLDLECKLLPAVAMMEYYGVTIDSKGWLEAEADNKIILSNTAADLYALIKETFFDSGLFEKRAATYIDVWGEDVYRKELITNTAHKGKEEAFVEEHADWLKRENLIKSAYTMCKLFSIGMSTKTERNTLMHITTKDDVFDIFKDKFKFSSSPQKVSLLQLFNIPVESAKKDELAGFRKHAIVDSLLNFSEANKEVTTYGVDFLDRHVSKITGRVHANFTQCGTATGRWASSNPNLQNQPQGHRKYYVPQSGYKFLTCDYSQAELRALCAWANEDNMKQAYKQGIDIHTMTASILFNVPVEDVTKDQRARGKPINFSIVYGTTAHGISKKNVDITFEEAQELIDSYFAGYPTLAKFIELVGDFVTTKYYSKTPLGRIRFFESNMLFKSAGKREAYLSSIKRQGVNHIIQGGSADILKEVIVRIFNESPWGLDDFRLVLQVHDEIVIEVKEDIAQEAKEFMKRIMLEVEQKWLGDVPAEVGEFEPADYWVK